MPVITLPYNATSDPYSRQNPHKGVDYRYVYEPVIVGGVKIGTSGNSGSFNGKAYKPHLHVQAWTTTPANTKNPLPYAFQAGRVVNTGTGTTWGQFVTIQVPDGTMVTYAHLSNINVSRGTVITPAPVQEQEETGVKITSTHQARMLALDFGWDLPGDSPLIIRAAQEQWSELKFYQTIKGSVKNVIVQRERQLNELNAQIDSLRRQAMSFTAGEMPTSVAASIPLETASTEPAPAKVSWWKKLFGMS